MSPAELNARALSSNEHELLMKMLSREFPGRDDLVAQVEGISARQLDSEGSLRLMPDKAAPGAAVEDRVPVEAELPGDDGIAIRVLLHVVGGYLHELEIYQDDLEPLKQRLLPENLRLSFPRDRDN